MTNAHTAKHRSVRLDLSPVRADAERQSKATKLVAKPTHVSPAGWRYYTGTAAFGDIIQAYPDLVPPRVEFRPWDEVKAPASVKSLRGVPLVGASYSQPTEHPGSDIAPPGRLLTAEDVKPHLEGAVLDAWADEATKSLRFEVVVYTAGLADALDAGTVEISLAYDPDEDETPGEFEGQRYDVVQRRIEYNAASVVDHARAERPTGEVARLDRAPPAATPETTMPPIPATTSDAPADTPPSDPTAAVMPLSAAGMALVDSMPPADKKMILAGLAMVAAGMSPAEEAAEGESVPDIAVDATPPPPPGTPAVDPGKMDSPPDGAGSAVATMDAAAVSKMIADAMTPVMDALGKLAPGGAAPPGTGGGAPLPGPGPTPPGRSDAAGAGQATHLDVDAIVAKASAAAALAGAKAGHAAHEAAGALRRLAHLDGQPDPHTAEDAVARMLTTITEHLPLLAPAATNDLKAGRMDGFSAVYKQAAALKAAAHGRLDADMRSAVFAGTGGDDSPLGFDVVSNGMTYRPANPALG